MENLIRPAQRQYDAEYFLRTSFEKQDRAEQNRAFLNDRLIILSRYLEDMAQTNPGRYQRIEEAYNRWSRQSGYGEDLSRLDTSQDKEMKTVLRAIDHFTQAAQPAR